MPNNIYFPLETILEIFKYTDGVTLGRCRRVSKTWRAMIDGNKKLWEIACKREYKKTAEIAKKKAVCELEWFHIYRNLTIWATATTYNLQICRVLKNSSGDGRYTSFPIDSGIFALNDSKGLVFYDLNHLDQPPSPAAFQNITDVVYNENVTVMLVQKFLLVQRIGANYENLFEIGFVGQNSYIYDMVLYFNNGRDIYKCNLRARELTAELVFHSKHNVMKIRYSDGYVHSFSDYGTVTSFKSQHEISCHYLDIPVKLGDRIRKMQVIDHKNYACYSKDQLIAVTNDYRYYFQKPIPTISTICYYGNFIVIGTFTAELQLVLIGQDKEIIFQKIGELPEHKRALHIDVCERKNGPLIIVITVSSVLAMTFDCLPYEEDDDRLFMLNRKMDMCYCDNF